MENLFRISVSKNPSVLQRLKPMGEILDELKENIKDAIKCHFDVYEEGE